MSPAATRAPATPGTAQAWVALRSDDPEAVSASAVARARLAAARGLKALGRWRLFEIHGPLPARAEVEALLHRSIQFYNPAKERCTVRMTPGDAAPLGAGEVAVCVVERDGDRRPGAERWWAHQTGSEVQVREAVVWSVAVEAGGDAWALAEELSALRTRAHGLLCNPHAQDGALARDRVPLPWISAARPDAAHDVNREVGG